MKKIQLLFILTTTYFLNLSVVAAGPIHCFKPTSTKPVYNTAAPSVSDWTAKCSILCICSQIFERDAIFEALNSIYRCKFVKKVVIEQLSINIFLCRNHYIAVAVSGKNLVPTAIRLSQLFFVLPNIQKVFFIGIGGSLNPNLSIGDVYIPFTLACHSVGYMYNMEGTACLSRYLSYQDNFKSFSPSNVEVGVDRDDNIIRTNQLACPAEFWNQVVAALKDFQAQFTVHCRGTAVSGTTFVDNAEYCQYLFETYNADVIDMESFAVACTCYEFQKHFCIIRGISDFAGRLNSNNDTVNAIDKGGRSIAVNNAANVFRHILVKLLNVDRQNTVSSPCLQFGVHRMLTSPSKLVVPKMLHLAKNKRSLNAICSMNKLK